MEETEGTTWRLLESKGFTYMDDQRKKNTTYEKKIKCNIGTNNRLIISLILV